MAQLTESILALSIDHQIKVVRGHRVMLDTALARIYGVTTERLLEVVNSHEPLPGDFCFHLEPEELAFSEEEDCGRSDMPYAFTEHGVLIMAALLESPGAIRLSAHLARKFAQLRTF